MPGLNVASERDTPEVWLPPWTIREHQARYRYARQFVVDCDVIDCACGSGESSDIFREAGARSVIGIDINDASIKAAAARYSRPGLRFAAGDGVALPVEDCSCDVLVSLETIEHIVDDRHFIREIARVLRPGGLLICSTPNRLVTNPGTTVADKP